MNIYIISCLDYTQAASSDLGSYLCLLVFMNGTRRMTIRNNPTSYILKKILNLIRKIVLMWMVKYWEQGPCSPWQEFLMFGSHPQ